MAAGILERVKFLFTGRAVSGRKESTPTQNPYRMRAKIDAAQTTGENKNHWANADAYSADAAYDVGTRYRLRNRSRYEAINNCYAKGVVRSSSDDLVGTGPRLQLSIPGDDSGENAKLVEKRFGRWADETMLAIKLRLAEKSLVRDGGCYGLFDTNERLRNPVKFDTRWLEAEFCTNPTTIKEDPSIVDGVKFDRFGNPIEYYFLTVHPGGRASGNGAFQFYTVPAERVVHWFRPDRFGQHHGIPELTAALALYSQLRRYSLATLTAAEFASMLAGIMKTDVPSEEGGIVDVDSYTMLEMVRGALMSLPKGWEAQQFKPEQPTTNYPDFKRELLNEIGRATGMPLNTVSGNSSGYNFSSGRLDHLPYHRGLRIARNDMRLTVLDPIFRDGWYPEAVLVDEVPAGLPPIEEWRWSWNWDGFDSIDQNKDATADDTRLKHGTTTYAEIFAAYGQDYVEQFEQMAREKALCEKLGLPYPILSSEGGMAQEADDPQEQEFAEENGTLPVKTNGKPGAKQTSSQAAAKAGDVQATALNGAQIASLVLVVDKLAAKQYAAEAAEKVIQAAFPLMDRKLIADFIRATDKFKPPTPPAQPAPEKQPPPADDKGKAAASSNGYHPVGSAA